MRRHLPAIPLLLTSTSLVHSATDKPSVLEELVITASGESEPAALIPQTIQTYLAGEISATAPRQLTDFFASRGLAQIHEAGTAHATILLRGSSTVGIGQGWHDGSEVAVLINGRPAGTANLGKFSTHDLERIEILQGPNSVLYGSSALGGVINLIPKNGRSFEGTQLTTLVNSFNRFSQILETADTSGDVDYYLHLSHTLADDYDTGRHSSGSQPNTAYNQRTATFSLGYQLLDHHRLDFTFRHDTITRAGHPGPTYSLTDTDDRYNTSAELLYSGTSTDEKLRWTNRFYWLRDTDQFHRSQDPLIGLLPAITAPGLIGTPGITRDFNERQLTEWGNRFAFHTDLIPEKNTLTLGADLRFIEVDNHRERTAAPGYLGHLIGIPVVMPPLAVNSRTTSTAAYLQDSHQFFDQRLKLTLGTRYDLLREQALHTENSPVSPSTETRDVLVYQVGATWKASENLTARANLGTGFLSASSTQLFGTIRTANGYTYLPNPLLKDETSFGWDLGLRAAHHGFSADVAYYENTIRNYIIGYLYPNTASLQWRNAEERVVRGIQAEISQDLSSLFPTHGISITPYLSGNTFLTKKAVDLTGQVADQYYLADYSFSTGIRAADPGKWSADLFVTASGPSEINAGFLQNANVPLSEIQNTIAVPSHALLHFTATWQPSPTLTLFGGINNLLNQNYHPYYIATNNGSSSDVAPWLLPGIASGEGYSAPGREYFAGFILHF